MHVWFEKHGSRNPMSNPLFINQQCEALKAQAGERSSLCLGVCFWAPCYSLDVNMFQREFEKKYLSSNSD